MLSPSLPTYLFAAPNGLHWCLNHAHWLTILHGQTHNVVAFLCLELMIGDCGAPLFERDHVGPASADRSEGSGGRELLTDNTIVYMVGRAGSMFCTHNY